MTFKTYLQRSSANGLVYVMVCLCAGVAIHYGSKKYHYPYTVGCFLFGVIVGLIKVNSPFSENFNIVTTMHPNEMLMTFLPILIFESSFAMDAHMFYKALPPCLILAVVGFLFCTLLTAIFAKYALAVYNWSWMTALVFGTIVSATDPVAVIALLKEMQMPHTFTVLIEGESLLNDGIAIVMYEMLSHQMISDKPFEFGPTSIMLVKTCLGAPVLGYILGKIAEWILIRIYISPVSEMTIILVLAYVTYFVAEEILGISAVVAVVLFGVTLNANRMCISPESENLIHTDWRLLSVYANTLIFMMVGAQVTDSFSEYFSPVDAGLILGTYLILTLLRSLMILIFFPCLRKIGYGLNWKEALVLSWGGLRGAIGLALSLMLALDPHIPDSANAEKVLIQVSGIIVLTLIVNANSLKFIMNMIKFKEVTLVNRLSMGNAIASVSEIKEKSLRTCKGDWKLMKANWEWVIERTKLEDPYKGGLRGEDPQMSSLFVPHKTCSECLLSVLPYELTSEELDELKEAARKKVHTALKGILWSQFRKGLLQRTSLRLLCTAADNVLDVPKKYLTTEDVREKYMKVSKLNHWLEIKLSRLMKKIKPKKNTEFELEMNNLKKTNSSGFRSFCVKIYFSGWFKPLILVIIVSHVAQIVTDIYFAATENSKYDAVMRILTIFYTVFYIVEVALKIFTLKWNLYIKVPWNLVDLAASVLAVSDGMLDVILIKYLSLHYVAAHFRILIIVRSFRYFYIVVNVFIAFLSFIRNNASSKLYYAYDIGRGFLFATDTVLKNIDLIVDFGPCAKEPVSVYQQNVQEMVKVLNEFEKNYPAIVVALKTNRAARKILNQVKDVLSRQQKRSVVLDEEAEVMKSILFEMTKTVVYAPRARVFIRDILKVLEEVDWINPELSKDIHESCDLVTYDSGEIIQKAGEKHEFVFIIAKGVVSVVGERYKPDKEPQFQLPNVDSTMYFKRGNSEAFHDKISISGTIGLLGYLQKTPSLTSVYCETDCELVQIEYSCLDVAREKFDNLIFSMWKSISIKIGLQILANHYRYKGFSVENIHLLLEKAVLPDLTKLTSLEVPEMVEDIIIIQGHVADVKTGMEFNAPSYIPGTSRHLKLLDDVNRRPPVIMMFLLEKKYWFRSYNNWVDTKKAFEACVVNV